MNTRAWLLLATLSVLWGGSFYFTEIALTQLEPPTIVCARVSLAAVALIIYLYVTDQRLPVDAGTLFAQFVMGGLNNVIRFSLIVWGQVYEEVAVFNDAPR